MYKFFDYAKALHVIFVVTWFSGLFYIVRLFIYNREAQDKREPEKGILSNQFSIMIKRLWFGITWPSAVITLIFGLINWYRFGFIPMQWLTVKLCFVAGLYAYHLSLHAIYKQQAAGNFKYSSQQLRIWNEVATIFLLAIVMLAVVKREINWWGIVIGLVAVMALLMTAIKIYKRVRMKKENSPDLK